MFFNHETANLHYLQYLREILKKNNEIVSSLDEFDLDSNSNTITSSQVQTSTESNIYFEETRIDCDAFDKIMKIIRTHDAKFVVIKKFSFRVNKKKQNENDFMWLQILRREFYIMKNNFHVYVS